MCIASKQAAHCVCAHNHTPAERKEASARPKRERERVYWLVRSTRRHMVRVEGRACRKAVSRGARGLRTNTHTRSLTRPFLLARCRREVSVLLFLACASCCCPEFGMIPYTACVGIKSGKKKTFRAEAQRWQVVHPANAELIITQVSVFPMRFFSITCVFASWRRA